MKGTDLMSRLTALGIGPTDLQVTQWIDTWQRDVCLDFPVITRATMLNIVANAEIALPALYLGLERILVNGLPYANESKVQITSDRFIIFPEDLASVVLVYRKEPTLFATLNTELEVPTIVQPIALYYLMGLYYDKEGEGDEESGMAARYMAKYESKKYELKSKLANTYNDDPRVVRGKRYRSGRSKWGDDLYE